MGASESIPLPNRQNQQQHYVNQITTVSEKIDGVDPIMLRIKSLKISEPILKSPPESESSLTDILVKKSTDFVASVATPSISGTLHPNVMLELFSMYREWQEEKAKKINEKQEEIEIKIETADALAIKLHKRFNHSVSSMGTAARNFAEVQPLQVEVGELKGRLTEVISNCDALCKRIANEGPECLRTSIKPFSVDTLQGEDRLLVRDARSS